MEETHKNKAQHRLEKRIEELEKKTKSLEERFDKIFPPEDKKDR